MRWQQFWKNPTPPLKWNGAHATELGADGTRIAVAGNSVGGNMNAAPKKPGVELKIRS